MYEFMCACMYAGILLEDDASGKFTHNIVCANLNEGVAVHGRAHPAVSACVYMSVRV
jgi:hypothetical protein